MEYILFRNTHMRYTINTCLKCDREFKARIFWCRDDDVRFIRICPECKRQNQKEHEEDSDACSYVGKNSYKHKGYGENKIKTNQGF